MSEPASQQESPPNPTPENQSPGGIGEVDVVGGPVPDFDIDVTPTAPAASAPANPDAHVGEAIVATEIFAFVVAAKLKQPLAPDEKARVITDLQPVLAKHGVPSFLPPEEAKLATTVAGIILPRIINLNEVTGDNSGSGKEGKRQVNSAPAAGVSSASGGIDFSAIARP